MGLKYGGKTTPDYSAMRGPCPKGFHVPSITERQGLNTIMTSFSLTTGDGWRINLHIPFVGYRNYTNAILYLQGSYGYYWSVSRYANVSSHAMAIARTSSTVRTEYHDGRARAFSVRAFKDSYVEPLGTDWDIILDGESVAHRAGIFWNQSEGLISITDGTTGYTIMDKNLGATTVYNDGDTLTEANMGNMYQWGNNYGFPSTGTISNTSSNQVDVSEYGPGNYYSSDTFIIGNEGWSPVQNDDLWGGVTGVRQKPVDIVERYYGGKLINDYSAMRGPCNEGFHIPMRDELTILYSYMNTLGLTDTGKNFKEKLLLPNASKLAQNTGQRENYSTYAYLKSCNSYNTYGAKTIQIANSKIYHGNRDFNSKSGGDTIRPFKDTSVSPDSSWTALYDGSSVAAGAGVFHNESLGLISVSSDGINWVTLADKNLGATIAYNAGDTLSEANCGKFYQWGNNYGFSWTGATTTSSTKVDASNYGPGNYYSSSIFITAENASSSTAWDTTNNQNLRGGVTGVQQKPTKVIEVYYGSTKIWPSYPAGIYWNPNIDGGVISISSNGTDWLTLADKNLGATTVYNLGDTMSEANCGKFYQRGNNYGFSYTGTPSISSTKVDVSSYGPNNYYSNSTFRRVNYSGNWRTDASTTAAFNLWGGVTGTVEAAQGPCPSGFHIPSRSDITNLVSMYIGLDILSDTDSQAYLKIPRMGIRDNYNATVNDAGTDGGFRSCTINTEPYESTYYPYACECWNQSQYQIQLSTGHMNSYCLGIRPFRNEAIMPDDTRIAILN